MPGNWDLKTTIIFLIPFAVLAVGVIVWVFVRRTIRTRVRTGKTLKADPDINEYLVVFGWTRKVLYIPTILASLGGCVLMLFFDLSGTAAQIVGGVWFGVFFANFLIDEYDINIKVLLIGVLCVIGAGLWLVSMGWLGDFLRFFRHLGISLAAMGYLLIAIVFTLAVVISWLKGLFYYVAITPNYLNVQVGPTETGEQIAREQYSTRVDTGDFLERLMGFGRIIITFSDQRRQPIVLLVGRIAGKAQLLESIRGKLAFDLDRQTRQSQFGV
ncbi:MAG: hypothetical protein KAX78_01325 [Phycisphaerae bacterium]|nr:hypothetical protein [Phycisphaerae bacterium]